MINVPPAFAKSRFVCGLASLALLGLSLAACGNGADAPKQATPDAGLQSIDVPPDSSVDGLTGFFDALEYRGSSWASGKDAPSEADAGSLSPHGLVRIFYNHVLRASVADGHGSSADPHADGSMVVKELYTGEVVVGHAAMLRTDGKWLYFCTASEGSRCYGGSPANEVRYQTSIENCACHGSGTIVTTASVPPP